jgi:uncharacterized circularly permuted ATP-grasp superfamily protein/uncharacterized alpha-E superfamily protein
MGDGERAAPRNPWSSDFRLGYGPEPGVHDEMTESHGGLRPAWGEIADFMAELSEEDWRRRWDRGLRTLREHGVTYNVYHGRQSEADRWRLDPVPMVLRADEWGMLSAALAQRAKLLDLILRDLLGPQTLLASGLIPPPLVFGHPGFFRPTVDAAGGDRQRLFLYGADLARTPDGQWRIMMDRTEAPSGFGYALENRAILGRVFPELMRRANVRPVSAFFAAMREGLGAAAPGKDDPRIVVLTPGPRNEAHFEHAYLARRLGCPLVEADDLTVRGGEVFLKTLQGLRLVDVILRRTDTAFCDPLELRGDSALGVAGLTHAAREGAVAVVNALGSGVVESPGLMPFMPGLCRSLLDEELRLPSVATWWCGQTQERAHVRESLDSLVVKPAFPSDPGEPVFGARADAARLAALETAIGERPERFIGQEYVRLSTAPTWSDHGLEPRAIMLRMLLCWTPEGWTVMPGGMVRVAPDRHDPVVSMQRGGGAKDVWVLGQVGPEGGESEPAERPPEIRRGRGNLPSRTADGMYWFGRYLERATAIARRFRGAVNSVDERLLPLATGEEAEVVRGLLGSGVFSAPETEKATPARLLDHASGLLFDPDHQGGLLHALTRLRDSAETVRHVMSNDTWLAVTRVHEALGATRRAPRRPTLLGERMDDVVYALQAANGSTNETMDRGHAWRFYDLGRRLETGLQMLELFSATVLQPSGGSRLMLETLLEVCDCVTTYRGRYRDRPEFTTVLDLLISDLDNPRSLGHQLRRITGHVEALAELRGPLVGDDERLAVSAFAAVRTADAAQLALLEDGERPLLGRFVEFLQSHLWEMNDAVVVRYFSHVEGRGRQLSIGLAAGIEDVL